MDTRIYSEEIQISAGYVSWRKACWEIVLIMKMENLEVIKNMGAWDRIIRILVAFGVLVLYLAGVISGVLAAILGVLAAVLVLTSLVGFCPLYLPFKLSTRQRK